MTRTRAKSPIFVFMVSLLATSLSVEWDLPREIAVAQEKKTPIGVGSVKAANQQLEESVRNKLLTNEELREARLVVTADMTRNQVTLSGELASSILRDKAVELARGAQVGVIVIDRIEVRRNSSRSRGP